ncbi:CMD domain protein [Rathayibacter sp. YIM 133350]|uniref:CMD domain protein n=1 Tax=Rathayibacter sp. YIM 133350 TaxID=3131992 RepID=UPI00307F0D92
MSTPPDVIDALLGVRQGSRIDALRRSRPETRRNAQLAYDSLFPAVTRTGPSPRERLAVAAFVAGVHGASPAAEHYLARLRSLDPVTGIADVVHSEVLLAATTGPYGVFPDGPLAIESVEGPRYRVADAHRRALGGRLAAAIDHAHLLVFRPREADASALQALADAGWSVDEIVTLSQLVSFLTFQVRVVAGWELIA